MNSIVESLLAELRMHFTHVNQTKFAGVLPAADIVVNRRLRALTGRIFYDERVIEMSHYHLVQPYGRDQAFKTLEHEMLHLYLDTLGHSPGHTLRFKRLAQELDIPVWHGLPYPKNKLPQQLHVYECPACGHRIKRARRLSAVRRSACGECCRRHNDGRFDVRFVMRHLETVRGEEITPSCETAVPAHAEQRHSHPPSQPAVSSVGALCETSA